MGGEGETHKKSPNFGYHKIGGKKGEFFFLKTQKIPGESGGGEG